VVFCLSAQQCDWKVPFAWQMGVSRGCFAHQAVEVVACFGCYGKGLQNLVYDAPFVLDFGCSLAWKNAFCVGRRVQVDP